MLVHASSMHNLNLWRMSSSVFRDTMRFINGGVVVGNHSNRGPQSAVASVIISDRGSDNDITGPKNVVDTKPELFANHPKNFRRIVASAPTPLDAKRFLEGRAMQGPPSADKHMDNEANEENTEQKSAAIREEEEESQVNKEGGDIVDNSLGDNASHEADQIGTNSSQSPRTHGPTPEFRGSLLEDGSTMRAGENITRLSYALYRVVNLFKFKSMIDYPAGDHLSWMPQLMGRLDYEHPDFAYSAVDPNETALNEARKHYDHLASSKFLSFSPVKRVTLQADVMLVWPREDAINGLSPLSKEYPGRMLQIMKNAKEGGIEYILLGQYPTSKTKRPVYQNGRWKLEGSSDDPFWFNDHIRGVIPMFTEERPFQRYLMLYALSRMQLDEYSL